MFNRCFSRLMPFRWPVHRPSCPIHPSSRGSCSARLSSTSPSPPPQASLIDRITAKLPRRLQAYTTRLRNAPASHVVSFLILHEFTAIMPLLALFALFHYTTYLPISYLTQHLGDQIESGLERYERYFRRKGWFGFDQEDSEAQPNQMTDSRDKAHTRDLMQRWGSGDTKYKILVEAALAYAITKALLPIRIIGSVWATPWFASVLMRIKDILTRKP